MNAPLCKYYGNLCKIRTKTIGIRKYLCDSNPTSCREYQRIETQLKKDSRESLVSKLS